MNTSIEQIKKEIAVDRQALLTHPLYKKVISFRKNLNSED